MSWFGRRRGTSVTSDRTLAAEHRECAEGPVESPSSTTEGPKLGVLASPSESTTEYLGLSDSAAETDQLAVDAYRRGLTEFLAQCPTPITVAVQGEWGSGKTTLMNFVAEDLDGRDRVAAVIKFNTWEMAFLDAGPILTVALMQQILGEVPVRDQVKRTQLLETLVRVAALRTLELAPILIGTANEFFGKAAERLAETATEKIAGPSLDLPAQVLEVRRLFSEQISTFLSSREPGSRIVVLIDDLDRLPPHRAVELMESLKSIMDCKGCVFVLAVDFSVVTQGIKEKYPMMSEDKGHSFFDKLVQVPFRMPAVGQETIRPLLDEAMPGETTEDLDFYTRVCWLASAGNPRIVKRVINSFLLMATIGAGLPSPRGNRPKVGDVDSPAEERSATAAVKERLLFCLQAVHVGFPTVAGQLEGDLDEVRAAAQEILDKDAGAEFDTDSYERLKELLDQVIDLTARADPATLAEVEELTAATTVGTKQDHTTNPDVQHVIECLFDRFAAANADGAPPPKGAANAVACFDQKLVSAGGYTITHLRRTRGKGQGLNFYIGREGMPAVNESDLDPKAPRIYISGDRSGRMPNDGFGLIDLGPRYSAIKNGKFDATALRNDPELRREFEEEVVAGLNDVVQRYADMEGS